MNVTLASDFISSNDGYYLVDGKQMTLECSYASAKEVSWKLNQKTLLQYSPITNTTGVGSGFENKVVTHTFSSYKHSLVLNVNKSSDEGSIVICAVKISGFGPTETGEVELKDILGEVNINCNLSPEKCNQLKLMNCHLHHSFVNLVNEHKI